MKKNHKILIAEDFPLTIIGYQTLITNYLESYNFEIVSALDCKECYQKVILDQHINYDILLLDINLPPFTEENIFSGEDLGLIIRKIRPDVKLVVITNLSDNHRLYNIFKCLNPDSILIKTDINEHSFIEAIKNVLNGKTYYSTSFSELLRKQFAAPFSLDEVDRRILYLLSIGTKQRELPEKIFLSISGVEKRIKRLKEYFEVKGASTFDLIINARIKGFI